MVIQLSCRKSIIYFSGPGEKNTEETFAAVKARAEELSITVDGVKYHIKKLRGKGVLSWIGSSKGGYWKILTK